MAITNTSSSTTVRLEAFSDAVIAITITLLVLEISVPHAKDDDLLDALLDQWPSYLAFIISFVVIGIMWVSHHSMFQRIAAVDRGLLFVNLILLLGIAFLPFLTASLAEYVADGGQNTHVSAAIYSATMTVIGCAFAGMWAYLSSRPHLLADGVPLAGNPHSVSPIARESSGVRVDDRARVRQRLGLLRRVPIARRIFHCRTFVTGSSTHRRRRRT